MENNFSFQSRENRLSNLLLIGNGSKIIFNKWLDIRVYLYENWWCYQQREQLNISYWWLMSWQSLYIFGLQIWMDAKSVKASINICSGLFLKTIYSFHYHLPHHFLKCSWLLVFLFICFCMLVLSVQCIYVYLVIILCATSLPSPYS